MASSPFSIIFINLETLWPTRQTACFIDHICFNMYHSFEWRVLLLLILIDDSQSVKGLDIIRFHPVQDFTKTGTFRKLDVNAFSSNLAGCVAGCMNDERSCIGFAYSTDLRKCVKSYTVGDLGDLSDGHWRIFYCKCFFPKYH